MTITSPAFAVNKVDLPVTFDATDIGERAVVNYNGYVGQTKIAGLTARTIFTLSSVTNGGKDWTFAIRDVTNTSSAPITASRISIFGFDTDKTVQFASSSNTIFGTAVLDGNPPQISQNFDVCFSGGPNCAGGGGGGILINQSAMPGGSFLLRLQLAATKLELTNFFVRYQSIAGAAGGDSGVGVSEEVVHLGVEPLPEPAVWVQLITGFGLAGAVMRRRRQTAAETNFFNTFLSCQLGLQSVNTIQQSR
ncbi:MAG: cistern family PEP-CTERM protein [Polymorphobacter sp.]